DTNRNDTNRSVINKSDTNKNVTNTGIKSITNKNVTNKSINTGITNKSINTGITNKSINTSITNKSITNKNFNSLDKSFNLKDNTSVCILTGTPVQNSPSDIFNLFDILNYGYLNNKSEILRLSKKCLSTCNENDLILLDEKLNILKRMIQPFVIRRLKTNVLKELPDKIIKDLIIEMADDQRVVYNSISHSTVDDKRIMSHSTVDDKKIMSHSTVVDVSKIAMDNSTAVDNSTVVDVSKIVMDNSTVVDVSKIAMDNSTVPDHSTVVDETRMTYGSFKDKNTNHSKHLNQLKVCSFPELVKNSYKGSNCKLNALVDLYETELLLNESKILIFCKNNESIQMLVKRMTDRGVFSTDLESGHTDVLQSGRTDVLQSGHTDSLQNGYTDSQKVSTDLRNLSTDSQKGSTLQEPTLQGSKSKDVSKTKNKKSGLKSNSGVPNDKNKKSGLKSNSVVPNDKNKRHRVNISDSESEESEWKRKYLVLDSSKKDKQAVVDTFWSGGYKTLVINTKIGSHGLNLSVADTVIFYEHDSNPFNDLQAMDRAHRIGQKNVVNVIRLIVKNTIEEEIMNLQAFKKYVAYNIIE
ncbi:SNF2 family DNA-dependent ATPase domain-containing protein, partial [Pseudoloma neurophilia]